MAIDYSLFAIPKQRVKALDKADKQKAIEAQDKAENAKAKKRAGGMCEVIVSRAPAGTGVTLWHSERCHRKDTQTHHLKGGIGRRNRGDSILAIQKLRVCDQCHSDITGKILKPTTAEHDASTVRYWRAK
jgi:hypothetical protein